MNLLQLWLSCQRINLAELLICTRVATLQTGAPHLNEKAADRKRPAALAKALIVWAYGFCDALRFKSFQPSGRAAAASKILTMSPGMNFSTVS